MPSPGAPWRPGMSKAAFHADFVDAPWRCFALSSSADVPADVYLGEADEVAVSWVLGLSSLLHALGRLERPLSPAALLWLRARMKLRQLAAREKRRPSEQLAHVVRQAFAGAGYRMPLTPAISESPM